MIIVTLHVKEDLSANFEGLLLHVRDMLRVLIIIPMGLHNQVIANLLKERFDMTEEIIVEHLSINVKILVVIRHLFFDPIRNVFGNTAIL